MAEQSGEALQQMQLEQARPDAVAAAAEPSVTTAAQALDLNSKDLVDKIYDSVATLCADGFDAVISGLRDVQVRVGSEEGPQQQGPSPEVLSVLWQGMERLHAAHQARVEEQVEKFEAHVMQTCLHVPAGLVAAPPPAPGAASQVDEAQLEQLAAQLAHVRGEIAAANQAARQVQRDIRMYDEALRKYGDLSELAAAAGALAGKENSAAEDAHALVAKGAALQGECEGLDRLGRQRVERARGPPKDALAAEKELLALHPGAGGITPADLRAFQDLLSRQ